MVTIAQIVREIIEEKPFVQEALSQGIVNNAALAQQLTSRIEHELRKPVKFSAVNMAIRRLAEQLEKTFVTKAKFDKDTSVTVKSDLMEIVIYKIEDVQSTLKKVYDLVDFKKGDFLTITQGLHELMIITDLKCAKPIIKMLPPKYVKKVIGGLSSLTMNVPEEAVETIGLFYLVTRALNWENINIIDIVSTFTEMTFIIKEDDTARAFNTLKSLIKVHS